MNPYNDQHLKMYFYENRLKTFEGWPFEEDCLCTPENVRTGLKTANFSTVGTFQNENPHLHKKCNINNNVTAGKFSTKR